MQQVNTLSVQGMSKQLVERLRAIEEKLAGAKSGAGDNGESIQQVISELQAIRAQLAGGGASGEQPQDAALEKSVDHDRMARAISELKSGEFDMQG